MHPGNRLNSESKKRKFWEHKTYARPFEPDTFSQVYNPNRHQHVTVGDALVDPNCTIRHENEMPRADPGYGSLNKRDTIQHDRGNRVIQDYSGRVIIKVDQEGGIFDGQLNQGKFGLSSKFNQGVFSTFSPHLRANAGKSCDLTSQASA